jgi:tyrosyl-tRNA synthetase
MVDNAAWLRALKYIEFLRDYGRYFLVSDMLRMETYRTRLETGLTFLEFNYALLQAYDFLELYRRHGCTLQIGGSDQWANILAGADLIRRAEGGEAYALTWPLLTDPSGEKMGKSLASGQVWLDPHRTTAFDFYQHWINVDDADVQRMLATYTFLPMDEIEALTAVQGEGLRAAKQRLAWEVTSNVHGEEEARKAQAGARRLFGGASLEEIAGAEDVPTLEMERGRLEAGVGAAELLVEAGLAESKGAARRLIEGGGAYLNKERLALRTITAGDLIEGALVLQAGRKRFVRVVAK